jgi:hypothetical protein
LLAPIGVYRRLSGVGSYGGNPPLTCGNSSVSVYVSTLPSERVCVGSFV